MTFLEGYLCVVLFLMLGLLVLAMRGWHHAIGLALEAAAGWRECEARAREEIATLVESRIQTHGAPEGTTDAALEQLARDIREGA